MHDLRLGDVEQELVLACLRPDADEPLAELVRREVRWDDILVAGLWHKVAFLVYERLRATGLLDVALTEGNLPLLLLNHWKQLTKVNARRSALYLDVAHRVSAAATDAGVDLVVSKGGPLLFGSVYTVAERKTYDVDFLARRADVAAVEAVMEGCGFAYGEYSHAREQVLPPRPRARRDHLLQGRGLPNFLAVPDDPVIDYLVAQVRFRIGHGHGEFSVAADPLIDAAVVAEGMRRVAPVDLAIQLALHIYREAVEAEYRPWNLTWNLIKLCDLDRYGRSAECPRPEEIAARAAELGLTGPVAFGVAATADVLPSAPLAAMLAAVGATDAEAERSVSLVRDGLWRAGAELSPQTGGWFALSGPKST